MNFSTAAVADNDGDDDNDDDEAKCSQSQSLITLRSFYQHPSKGNHNVKKKE